MPTKLCTMRGASAASAAALALLLAGCSLFGPSTPEEPVLFNPAPGTYDGSVTVSLAAASVYTTVYYTTDGTPPDVHDSRYVGPFGLSSTTTVRAVAVRDNGFQSDEVTAEYTIIHAASSSAAKPVFSPAPGAFSTATDVSLAAATPGASIYYTTDGSEPDIYSTLYDAPIRVTTTTTIKAIAVDSGLNPSETASGYFIIDTSGAARTGMSLVYADTRPSYEITDYALDSVSAGITLGGFVQGERILLIPIHGSETAYLDATGNHAAQLSITVDYAGDAPPAGVRPVEPATVSPTRDVPQVAGADLPDVVNVVPPPGAEEPKAYLQRGDRVTAMAVTPPPAPVQGDVISMWLEANYGQSDYEAVDSTILYVGTRCYVVMTGTLAGHPGAETYAAALGTSFDTVIYDRITGIYGYEWGGDPNVPDEAGGIDGEPRVCIVLNSVTANPPGGVFRSVNEFPDADAQEWWGYRSNEREMFEIFVTSTNIDDQVDYSGVAAHEFQHLIEFNQRYRIHAGTYESSFINEGLSMVAEDLAGFGPDLYRLAEAQEDLMLSYIHWNKTPHYTLGQGYSAAYLMMNYAVRRFGTGFIADLLHSADTGLASFESVLSLNGFTRGYSGLVLDAVSAHYLNDPGTAYSHPAGDPHLYAHDDGIDTRSVNSAWSAYQDNLVTWRLRGPEVVSIASYPTDPFDVALYEYGVGLYELLSGDNGVFELGFDRVTDDIFIRIIRLAPPAPAAPLIDGRGWDWTESDLAVTDAYADASAADAADIVSVYSVSDGQFLYIFAETAGTAPGADTTEANYLTYRINLDIVGDSDTDYSLYLHETQPLLYEYQPWSRSEIVLESIQYLPGEGVEARIPYAPFGADVKSVLSVSLSFGDASSGTTVWDDSATFQIAR